MTRTISLIQEPHEAYNEKRDEYLTATALKDFIKRPDLCRAKRAGEIVEPRRRAFDFGAAAHKLILEGPESFEAEYVVTDGPINPKTGEPFGPSTKAYKAWFDENIGSHLQIVSTADKATIDRMAASVRAHSEARHLLASGEPEGVIRTSIHNVQCQVRLDFVNWDEGLVDFKTITNLDDFYGDDSHYHRFDYGLQVGFYSLVFDKEAGYRPPFWFIVTEKNEPFHTGVFRMDDAAIEMHMERARLLIQRVAECETTGVWPTNYEEARVIG